MIKKNHEAPQFSITSIFMKKSAKKVTIIGIFVIVAVTMLVALIVTIGGNKWAQVSLPYRMYFSSSVKGLSIGAPVMFRGISIGEVSQINLAPQENPINKENKNHKRDILPVEVHIKIFPEKLGYYSNGLFKFLSHNSANVNNAHSFLGAMVLNQNLRAELGTLSLLTGQIYVSLNFAKKDPEEPDWLVPKLWQQGIIPSNLSFFDRISSKMNDEDFAEQISTIKNVTKQITRLVNDGSAQEFLQDISTISDNLSVTSAQLRDKLPDLLENLQIASMKTSLVMDRLTGTMERIQPDIEATVSDTKALVGELNGLLEESRPDLNAILDKLHETMNLAVEDLERLQKLIDTLQTSAEPGSLERERLEDTLNECQKVLTQLATFLDTLNKNPQALLLGK